jgi:hypothetical protein
MTRLLGIIFFGFVSCQQQEKGHEQPSYKSEVVDSMQSTLKQFEEKKFSLDEIYEKYISEELQSYLERNHPAWSVPNQNRWYPQLFNKYKTRSSLVNYIQGDFDCNGKMDYALIIDKGNNILGTVAFLRFNKNFKTVELTELGNPNEKINYTLTLYKPGRYDIADPDLNDTDQKYVNLKCSSVGIGYFKELYGGGDDVFYWQQGELRSCMIEK